MSSLEVTGWTPEEVEEHKENFHFSDTKDFEDHYCLIEIPRQPDDYQGPVRYCGKVTKAENNYCKFHGGTLEPEAGLETLDPLASLEHGMYALDKHLKEDFSEKDQALYDWVTETFPQAYDISVEEDVDPASQYDIHQLALEIVRAERGEAYVLEEGEVTEQERYTDEGELIINEEGEVETEKSQHYLTNMVRKQRNQIMQIEKHLGISRNQRLRRDDAESDREVMEGLADSLGGLIGDSDQEYNPEEFEDGNS